MFAGGMLGWRRGFGDTAAMPFIRQVSDEEATGDCRRELEATRQRAGRVWNIVRIMTPNPAVLRASMQLYQAVMYGPSQLSRR